jgi:hypothetical protein
VHGAVFKIALEDAISSHACSLEASKRVTNGIPLRCPLLLPVGAGNYIETLKAWGDEYCHIAYCIHPGKYPSAHALFPPSADAMFHRSIMGVAFPKAAIGGGSFWHWTEELNQTSEEFGYVGGLGFG